MRLMIDNETIFDINVDDLQSIILSSSSILVICSSSKCQAETVISSRFRKRIFMKWARMYKRSEYIAVFWRFLLSSNLKWFQWAMILFIYVFVVLFCFFLSLIFFVIKLRTRLDTYAIFVIDLTCYLLSVDERKLS